MSNHGGERVRKLHFARCIPTHQTYNESPFIFLAIKKPNTSKEMGDVGGRNASLFFISMNGVKVNAKTAMETNLLPKETFNSRF